MIKESVLHNGVKFICDTVENTLTCSVGFFFSNGSRDETNLTSGFAHFLEHMLFKGTKNRSAYDIAIEIDRVGGSINAYTDKEITCYYCTLPAVHAELAIEVLSDMISHPTLSEEDIEKEKIVVVNEMRASEDSPEECSYQYYLNKLWPSHPLARKIAGEITEVQSITSTDLREFYETVYRSDALTIVIAGNVDYKKIISIIQKNLMDLNYGIKQFIRTPPKRSISRDYISAEYQQAQIYLGTVLSPIVGDLERFYCFLVFSTAFGESMSSRLFQHIREDLGLCYTVESFRSYYSDTWLWTIYASAMPKLVPQLLECLNAELHKLCNQPLSSVEVNDAINHIAGGMVFAQEDMEIRMKRLVNQQQIFGRIIDFKESIEIVRSISHLNVADLSSEIMHESLFNLLSYGIKKTKQIRRVSFDW